VLANERRLLSAKTKKTRITDEPHPLLSKFIEDGPLTPMFHNRWNPRTGKIDPLPTKNPVKKKKKKKKEVVDVSDDEESSVAMDSNPFAFLTKKTDLGDIAMLAARLQSPPKDGLQVDTYDLALGGAAGDNVSEVSPGSHLGGESLQTEEDKEDLDPLSRAQKEAALKQNVFNQLWAMMEEVDSIRNPRPYRKEGWSKADKKAYRLAEQDRKLQLIATCEAIA
jgi:hypothetical protein